MNNFLPGVSVFVGALMVVGPSFAADQPAAPSVADGKTILELAAPRATALTEFEQMICPLNKDGGMLTSIVNAALMHGGGAEYEIAFSKGKDARAAAFSAEEEAAELSFPWYRPNCDRPTFLTDHTRKLCAEAIWSEPIFESFIGYFTRADYDRPLETYWHLMGSTICVSGKEFPNLLRERGVSENNARIMIKGEPGGCLDAVVEGAADIAVLPDAVADHALRDKGLLDQIVRQPGLDELVGVHAIASRDHPRGAAAIATLNAGLEDIRESGEWFEIVAGFLSGHDHDARHEHAEHSHDESHDNTHTAHAD